ncbi:TetR-like C-terminal domain-containing protein [Embleya sp. NPDC005575]|uniref:TetR-like C-terminal domain-containing protein n=1 Tax=Embleya sp. NPDC005575 TaxID=3156892 RepID=UPI0033B0D407
MPAGTRRGSSTVAIGAAVMSRASSTSNSHVGLLEREQPTAVLDDVGAGDAHGPVHAAVLAQERRAVQGGSAGPAPAGAVLVWTQLHGVVGLEVAGRFEGMGHPPRRCSSPPWTRSPTASHWPDRHRRPRSAAAGAPIPAPGTD